MGFEGILGLIVLIADIWAIVQIMQSGKTNGTKLFWILIILLLPVIGVLAWFIVGRR